MLIGTEQDGEIQRQRDRDREKKDRERRFLSWAPKLYANTHPHQDVALSIKFPR
jgi:hypothetical protein